MWEVDSGAAPAVRFSDVPMRCFQGVNPAIIATCTPEGIPNITYLSQVFRIDERHVALSCQFFNKTKQNVLVNPRATVELYDPATMDAYRLVLRYDHAETEGPLYETMKLRIEAIASQTGMKGVFRLLSSDVYEVLECELREGFLEGDLANVTVEASAPRGELKGLQLISQRACCATSLDDLLTSVLGALDEALGFTHSMVLVPDESGARLVALASRGYGPEGIGAEVMIGDGLIGIVARERRLLRLSGVEAEMRYGRAVRSTVQQTGGRQKLSPEVPLPGLSDAQSHMALPLAVSDRLVGVLAVESRVPLAFDEWDEAYLEIIANQFAVSIENMLLKQRSEESPAIEPAGAGTAPVSNVVRKFRFFQNDDCVFVGDEYLIRNVPGRILWKLLKAHAESGRTEFSNRELRLDPWLGLPEIRDNLESRLVLLRKRLELKCPDVRLVSTGRGHFRLEASCRIELEEKSSA